MEIIQISISHPGQGNFSLNPNPVKCIKQY